MTGFKGKWTLQFTGVGKTPYYVRGASVAGGGKKRSIYQHREVMERHLGRPLREGEVVHHINLDSTNNSLDNLEVVSHSTHQRLHKMSNAAYRSLVRSARRVGMKPGEFLEMEREQHPSRAAGKVVGRGKRRKAS